VVFSHGWPLNADAWDDQLNLVAGNGFRAIAHDRRGHGRSGQPWDGNEMDTYADDAVEAETGRISRSPASARPQARQPAHRPRIIADRLHNDPRPVKTHPSLAYISMLENYTYSTYAKRAVSCVLPYEP
jgi:hypothetical protein